LNCIILRGPSNRMRAPYRGRTLIADLTPLIRDEWYLPNLDGVHFDWREDGRVLLTWRARSPLPDAGETKPTLNRVVFASADQAEAAE
jgi:hypothetical protein